MKFSAGMPDHNFDEDCRGAYCNEGTLLMSGCAYPPSTQLLPTSPTSYPPPTTDPYPPTPYPPPTHPRFIPPRTTLARNTAPGGGALYATYNCPFVSFDNCTVAQNAATGPEGGGAVLFNSPRGTLRVSGNSVFANNTSGAAGGAVMVQAAHLLHFADSALFGNVAAAGGGGAVGFSRADPVRDLSTCVNGVRTRR